MTARDTLTTAFGWITVLGLPLCFAAAAPVWAWVSFVLIPGVAWLTLGRAWLGALIGAIIGLSA